VIYLLDTHTLVWWLTNDPQLSAAASFAIEDDPERCAVSAVTAYEIGVKVQNGKWETARAIYASFEAIMASNGFRPLPISLEAGLLAPKLPTDHRDPFDRLLAAQAIVDHLDVVTIDSRIKEFGARVLW
jgi:PIN domain nuclease of toxin-antitoxin system